ncbi:MAG TPA: DMT family transporter [Actinocrinis sp.]|nr:DMT family transporter [Actinocrinis sp.]
MSRRGWILFGALSIIWGIPYLLIKVVVADMSPEFLVFARTAIGALILIPVAARRGQLRPALRAWKPVAAFAVIEIGGAWLLLNNAEQHMTSSLAGLLIAMVPLISTVLAWGLGDRGGLAGLRLVGLVTGLAGVVAVVGLNLAVGTTPLLAVLAMVATAVCYAVAPMVADRRLGEVPPLGVIALSLAGVATAYLPAAVIGAPHAWPNIRVLSSVLVLGVVCTVAAFLVFFALIAQVGPVRATFITYINPLVALLLGVAVLGEKITTGMLIGLPLILAGSYLATRRPASQQAESVPAGLETGLAEASTP